MSHFFLLSLLARIVLPSASDKSSATVNALFHALLGIIFRGDSPEKRCISAVCCEDNIGSCGLSVVCDRNYLDLY